MNLEREIHGRVEAFLAGIAPLLRQQALDAVEGALRGDAQKTSEPSRPRRRLPRRRSPAELQELQAKILAAVQTDPGQRIEQLSHVLNVPTQELTLPTVRLLEAGMLRRAGQRRATRYYPRRPRRTKRPPVDG